MEIASAAAVAEDDAATRSSAEACSLDNYLAQPDHTMDDRIAAARAKLGTDVVLLGHHYQRDEVIRFADFTGDSYKLSKVASETNAKYMLFCGVHFMAETADVLGQPWQQVILPDLNAGCSMADMAEIGQVEDCWDSLERAGLTVLEATDGAAGLETYRQKGADIVIVDIFMPGRDGLEFIRDLRADRHKAKIIAMSGGGQIGQTDMLKAAAAFGASRTFSKPVVMQDLVAAVRELLQPRVADGD